MAKDTEKIGEFIFENLQTELMRARSETDTNPTDGQKEAGNYKKGHVNIHGFNITIENPKGSYRSGKDKNGKPWKTLMHNDYGYFTRTLGKDGDAVDVFIGSNLNSEKIFPIDQYVGGKFDETKVMLGFNSAAEAKRAYLSNYEKDWKGFKYITEVSVDEFKDWLYNGRRQRKAFAKYIDMKKNVVKNSLNESIAGETYFAVYDNKWDEPFERAVPVCELTENDINEDGEICVNGNWDFVISEWTNFYADGTSSAKPGDLVFDAFGNNAVYRRGLGVPVGCETVMGIGCVIGTKDELIKFALEFANEIKQDNGIDTRAIFGMNEAKTAKCAKKNTIKLKESTLRQIVAETVKKVMEEDTLFGGGERFQDSINALTEIYEKLKGENPQAAKKVLDAIETLKYPLSTIKF